MFQVTNQFDLAEQSLKGLNKLKASRQSSINESIERATLPKVNYAKFVFEEYDDDSFETKIKMDSAYYNILLDRLDESNVGDIQLILGQMMKTVKSIYETVNIKPKIYGLQRLKNLNESTDAIAKSASRIISDFINRSYYRLTQEERENKYIGRIKHISKDLIISENVDPKDAVSFSLKAAVIEDLLEHINFPMTVKNEIESNLTSSDYAQMFDPQILNDMWDTYQEQAINFSKIVATII